MPLDRGRRLLLGLALLAAFLGVYALSNLTAAGQLAENTLLRAKDADGMLPQWIDSDAPLPPFVLALPTLAAGTLLAAALAAAQRRWRALATVVAAPLAVGASQLFKDAAGRPRLTTGVLDLDVSYPSGHAAIAFAVSAALLVAVPAAWLRFAVPVLAGWAVLVAAVLQAVGEHRSSEVLGSALLVAGLFLCASAVAGGPVERSRPASRSALAASVVLAVGGSWNTLPWAAALYAGTAVAAGWTVVRVASGLREDADQRRRGRPSRIPDITMVTSSATQAATRSATESWRA